MRVSQASSAVAWETKHLRVWPNRWSAAFILPIRKRSACVRRLPRFLDMEQQHRSLILAMLRQGSAQKTGTSGARYSLFLSFDRGLQVLVEALGDAIRADVKLNTRVLKVELVR